MAILTTIVAWETFQVLATILIFMFLNKILKKWAKDKSEKKKQIKKVFAILVIFMGLIIIFSGFYTVHTNEKVVLTKFFGEKQIIEDVGIKYSFLGKAETFDMRKLILNYPTFGQTGDLANLFGEEELLTLDNKIVRHSAVLYYQITDLDKYAIKSKDTENKLFYNLGAELTRGISTNTYDEIMNNREEIEIEIKNSLKSFEYIYGIEMLDFKFLRITDPVVTMSAKAEAEAEKIKSKAMINSAISEAEAIKIKYNSVDDKDFIKYLEFINTLKQRSSDTMWITNSNNPLITS